MRKSLRLFLVLAMACMMSLSFFFAGSLLAKADGSVDFAATEGASIYFAGDENDLGINYQIKLKKQDFETLKALPENAGKTIAFGGVYGLAYGNADELTAETGSVVISNTDGVFESLDEEYYVYNAELILDADAMYEEEMAGVEPENVITLSEYKTQLIAMPWFVKPFYAVYEGEFNEETAIFTYGQASSARMLFAVAAAVEAAGEDTPFDFKDKYQYNSQVTDYVVTLDAAGNFGGDTKAFTENTVAFIVGDSAEMFMYQDGQFNAAYSTKTVAELVSAGMTTITTVEIEDEYVLNVFRHSFAYAEESVDSIAINAEGKMYLNKLDTTGKVITSAFVDGVNVLKEDGTLDLALAGKEVGDKFLLVLANETSNLFAIANAEVYDKVFENTLESRQEMRDIFSAGGREHSNSDGVKAETVTGRYALAENLTFDISNLPSFEDQGVGYEEKILSNEFFNNNGDSATRNNIFAGVFDGRGFTINNAAILLDNGGTIFGYAGDGAVIKNVAFNEFVSINRQYAPYRDEEGNLLDALNGNVVYTKGTYEVDGVPKTCYYDLLGNPYLSSKGAPVTSWDSLRKLDGVGSYLYYEENSTSYSKFFYKPSSINNTVTLENVYIKDSKANENASTGSLLFFSVAPDDANKDTLCKLNLSNVVVENVSGPMLAGANTNLKSTPAGFELENVYYVSNVYVIRGTKDLAGFNRVASIDMITDTEDFVNSGFWSVVDGQLAWADLAKVAYVLDSESKAVESISASGVYTLGIAGVEGEIASVITSDSENVTVNGNQITVAGGYFSANVTIATLDGKYSKTYAISIDERAAVSVNEEVLLSETSSKFYLKGVEDENGANIENIVIDSISYNGKVVYADGAWNFDLLDVDYDTSFVLTVSAADNKYSFNNVVLYTEYFENTAESRAALVKALGGKKETSNTGAYALVEDLYFDGTVAAEQFQAAEDTIFDGIFNGRGYTLFDITMVKLRGMFGGVAGTATLKNFAIKGITTSNGYSSILFSTTTADTNVTMENVYIYRYVDRNRDANAIFVYNKDAGVGTWDMTNVIVEQEFDPALEEKENDIFATKSAVLNGNASGVYFLTNGDSSNVSNTSGTIVLYRGSSKYPTLADARKAMVDAEYDYTNFSDKYWVIDADGLPAWKTCYTDAYLVDGDSQVVSSQSFTQAGVDYSVVAYYNGAKVDATLAKAEESELVSIAGNVITIGDGFGSVVVNASYNETVIGSFTFNVDTRSVTTIADEILVSKANNKMYLAGTGAASLEIASMLYEGQSIYTDSALDASIFTAVGPENAYTVRVETTDGALYELTKVVACTNVFENTPESRTEMARTFSAGKATSTGNNNYTQRVVEGYYALAESLTFSSRNENGDLYTDEAFANNDSISNIFRGTFDGRGYTLNNVIYFYNCQGGIFGYAGDGATVKNVALNGTGRFKNTTSYGTSYPPYSMFFHSPETATSRITVENVYVKRTGTQNGEYYGIFFYAAFVTGVNYIENYNETGKTVEEKTYATGILNFNNVVTDGGLSKTTSMISSQGYYYEVQWNEETEKYEYVLDSEGEKISRGNIAKYPSVVRDGDTVTNTYFVGGKFARACAFPAANGNNVFNSVSAMSEITDTQSFIDSGYWSVVEGVLTWNTLPVVVE